MFLSTSFSISVYSITGRLAISKMQRSFSLKILLTMHSVKERQIRTPTNNVQVGTFPPAQRGYNRYYMAQKY